MARAIAICAVALFCSADAAVNLGTFGQSRAVVRGANHQPCRSSTCEVPPSKISLHSHLQVTLGVDFHNRSTSSRRVRRRSVEKQLSTSVEAEIAPTLQPTPVYPNSTLHAETHRGGAKVQHDAKPKVAFASTSQIALHVDDAQAKVAPRESAATFWRNRTRQAAAAAMTSSSTSLWDRVNLLQRAVRHWRRLSDPQSYARMQDAEELEMFLGLPKIVWVLFVDVLAVFLFFFATKVVAGEAMKKVGPTQGDEQKKEEG